MRRVAKWLGRTLATVIGLPALALLIALIAGNTGPGQHLLEDLTTTLTSGQVRLTGLSGRFPDALKAAHVELADPAGSYLTMDGVVLDWSPLRLLHGELAIGRLIAGHAVLQRLPQSSGSSSSELPMRLSLRQFHVDRLDIAPPVAGTAMALALDGFGNLDSLRQGSGQLTAQRLDGDGHYALAGMFDASSIHAEMEATEPEHGLIGGIANLPGLGALAIDAALDGPRSSLATRLSLRAGALQADAQGRLDLEHDVADLTVSANASAMAPRPDVSWQSVTLNAHVQGPFTRPDAAGRVRIERLAAAGAGADAITADLAGNAGQVELHAALSGVRLSSSNPDLLAATPMTLDATARLDMPGRPIEFSLHHTLFSAEGSAQTEGALHGQLALTVPEFAPFAAVAGTNLAGRLALTLRAALQGDGTQIDADGTFGVTGGPAPIPSLVGESAHFTVAASLHGQALSFSRLRVNGRSIAFSMAGSIALPRVDLDWTFDLANLADVEPTLAGNLRARGHLGGVQDNLALSADLAGEASTGGVASGPLSAHLDAQGLPSAPSAKLTAEGALLGAPIDLAVSAERRVDGTLQLTIGRADWKSAHAEGALSLAPSALVPEGNLRLAMQRLNDFAPLLGRPVTGSANLEIDAGANQARVAMDVRGANLPGVAGVSRAELSVTIDALATHPAVDATLVLSGVSAGGLNGSARLQAKGPPDAVALTVSASLPDVYGAAAQLSAAAMLNAQARSLGITTMQADWRQQTLRLLAPVRIAFADGIAFDHLRLGLRQATLDVSGRIGGALALTGTVRNMPADLAGIVSPSLAADGTVQGEARLTGTTARPAGTLKLTATGLRPRSGPGRAMPPANLSATADLQGTDMRIDARLAAGASHLTLAGRAPLLRSGTLDLHAAGMFDLAMLNPLLAVNGRQVRGQISVDAAIAGTLGAPLVSGTAQLANGDVQDYPLGVHIADIAAKLQASGDTIRLVQFSGRAGPGTLGASGSIGVSAAMPVELKVTARNAQPLASDLLTAQIDADVSLHGDAASRLAMAGTLHINRADIRIPEKLPESVATIPVRIASRQPPPPAAPPLEVGLNLTIAAPSRVFVRGRGIDADLGGTVHVHGTSARPEPDGGFSLRRGTFSVAGHVLNFTEGQIGFTGGGLTNPALHLVATSSTSSVTATLTVGGTAREPKITLSSVPELPQDEVMARLLFNQSVGRLSPFQLAEIAAGLASLAGAPSGLSDPLSKVRTSLGLDVLSMGSSRSGSPTLDAGRYVAPGIYLGARQNTSGTGSQAAVQIDIAKGLKIESTVGTSSGNATGAAGDTGGASVGLTYQFEY